VDFRAIAMGVAFALMWSSAFSAARTIVLDAPPLTALAARFLVSGILGVVIARAMGQSWRLTPAQWRATLIFGFLQNGAYLGLNFIAMQRIEASLAAIIASSLPLFVALADRVFRGARTGLLGLAGLAAGFAGVLVIMIPRLAGGADGLGIVLSVIGVIALAGATMTLRGASAGGGNLLMVVGLQLLVGAVIVGIPAAIFEPFEVAHSPKLWLNFLYVALFPGLLATWVWFALVGRIGTTRAATFHFLNPGFGVAVASVFLGERLGAGDVLGTLIVAAGILAVQLARSRAGTRPG
jgi:drug/metabolite transporter (DMT)-like permease